MDSRMRIAPVEDARDSVQGLQPQKRASMASPEAEVLLLRASGADSEPEGWEVVSSSSEGGEARAAEEAALAASFLLGEPSPPASPPSEGAASEDGAGAGSDGEAGEHDGTSSSGAAPPEQPAAGEASAPSSPIRVLPAAPPAGAEPAAGLALQPGTPMGGSRSMGHRPTEAPRPRLAAGLGRDGAGGALRPMMLPVARSSRRMAQPHGAAPADDAPAEGLAAPGQAVVTSADDCGGSGGGGGMLSRCGSVHLLVVRSDEQEELQAALAALEKRATQRELELSLARRRLRSTQAVAAERAREARTLRKLFMLTASLCAFLGLRSLTGSPMLASSSARPGKAGDQEDCLPSSVNLAAAVPGLGLPPHLQASLEHLVAVQVEPLPAAA